MDAKRNRIMTLYALVALAALVSLGGCGRSEQVTEAVPTISKLHPPEAFAGVKFQVQSDGNSAIAVAGSNYVKGTRILFDGKPLETAYGGKESVTATVPDEYIATPRIIEVRVENPDGRVSDPALFTVIAKR